jgi:hypothetical protein
MLEIIGTAIFIILVNIGLWRKGFYSRRKRDVKFRFEGKTFDSIEDVTKEMFKDK